MEKEERIARIAFEVRKDGTEQWVLQTWDDEYGWSFVCSYPFVNAVEYPNSGNNFIHLGFVKEVLTLHDLGYYIQPNVAVLNEK